MSPDDRIPDFPRDEFLALLQSAQRLFATEQDRRNLLAGLGLGTEAAQRSKGTAAFAPASGSVLASSASTREDPATRGTPTVIAPSTIGRIATPADKSEVLVREDPTAARGTASALQYEVEQLTSSPAKFASDLIDLIARPSSLDAATTLARRAIAEGGAESSERWQNLLQQLAALQRKHRFEEGSSPDVAGFRQWLGFECRHQYSLADRFIGREQYVKELDDWVEGDSDVSVRCVWALGGGGKSALAWYWLSRSLPSVRSQGYQGAFWCSFYEKNFNFDEFLRRALIFAGQRSEKEVRGLARRDVEVLLLEVMVSGRFLFVLDGLERLMNGYAVVANRAVDLESLTGAATPAALSRTDRRMVDHADGAFLRQLARAQQSRVLITSRLVPADLEDAQSQTALQHAAFTELPGLTEPDALQLWRSILPAAPITNTERAVFRACGYHPLVISILARSVAHFGGDFQKWLDLETHRDFKARGATSEAAVRSHVIGICLRDLPEASHSVLGVLTGTGKPMTLSELTDVLTLKAKVGGDVRGVSEEQVSEHLRSLLALGLIGEALPPEQPAEYDVHPVVRGAVWDLLTDPNRERGQDYVLSELAATPDRRGPDELENLDTAVRLYRLHIDAGQLDRAWELFMSRLWFPLFIRHSANRQVRQLFALLLPNQKVLQLLPLTSRRAQADATARLGELLTRLGEGGQSKTLLRWCAALRLQIGDLDGFLEASHTRAWQTMYEGKLFETELALRQLKLQALAYGAPELRPVLECWVGIILALRGDKVGAKQCFANARGRTPSNNWWVQGLAEGMVYLGEGAEALTILEQLDSSADDDEAETLQVAWEKLTEGMACVLTGNYTKAKDALAIAYNKARQASYAIVERFALAALAENALNSGDLIEAEEWLSSYRESDPDDAYALCAADARRVQARCIARKDTIAAADYARRAYELAACDGPPFVYKSALGRALETLQESGAYVPMTLARLDPQWHEQLAEVEEDERRLEQEITGWIAEMEGTQPITFDEAILILQERPVLRTATSGDRKWWEEVTGGNAKLQVQLMEVLDRNSINLASFRKSFDASQQKSLIVVFYRMLADRVVHPQKPRPVRELGANELATWLTATNNHTNIFDAFLRAPLAQRAAQPFQANLFDEVDIAAFLTDYKRRIASDADATAEAWWDQLEKARAGIDMLVLAECVLVIGTTLPELVAEISVGSENGLTYAFYAVQTRRAVDRFESKSISTAEVLGDEIDVLLRLQDVKFQIGWSQATPEARQFWEKLERDNEHRVRQVLRLAEELRLRDATIHDYYESYVASNSESIQANLAHVDYQRHRAEPWSAASVWPSDAAGERWAYETIRPRFIDTRELTENQIAARVELLMQNLGWDRLDEEQKDWWKRLQERVAPAVLLRFAEELDARRASIGAIRTAHIDGGTDNIVAALAYLDFSVFKRSDETRAAERAAERNRTANELFERGAYREAVQSYEEAIKQRPSAVFFSNLAGAWEHIKDITAVDALRESVSALRRGLEKFPDSSDLRAALKSAESRLRLTELGALVPAARSHSMLPVVTPIALEIGADLIPLIEGKAEASGSTMILRMPELRDRILGDTGIAVPGTRFRGNDTDLPGGMYIIMLDEIPLVSGTVSVDKVLTFVPPSELAEKNIDYEEATSPLDGSDACWIAADDAKQLTEPVWDATEYMLRHLEAVLRANLGQFAGLQEVLNKLEETWGPAASTIASDPPMLARFTRMSKTLLDERVSLKTMQPICEAFIECARAGQGMDEILSAVRMLPSIRPQLPCNHAGPQFFELDEEIENALVKSLVPLGDEFVLALEPEYTQEVLSAVRNEVGNLEPGVAKYVLVVRDRVLRRYVRKLVELEFPRLYTLSTTELVEEAMTPARTTITLD